MTSVEIRDTPFATWRDPDAWMEKMRGPQWKAVLRQEKAYAQKYGDLHAVKKRLGSFRAYYEKASDKDTHLRFTAGNGQVEIIMLNRFFLQWRFTNSRQWHMCRDLAVSPAGDVWNTHDIGSGSETFQLSYFPKDSTKPLWHKSPVGPDVAMKDGLCYYLGVEKQLWYNRLYVCNAKTGKENQVLLENKNPMVNLALHKMANQRLLLSLEDSQDFVYYTVQGKTLHKGAKKFLTECKISDPIDSEGHNFVITKKHGEKTLWKCYKKPIKILQIHAGEIIPNPWALWDGLPMIDMWILKPDSCASYYIFDGSHFQAIIPTTPNGLTCDQYTAKSRDGTKVHYLACHKANTIPKHLMVIGYGAYGMTTGVGNIYLRWAPLLENDWAIVTTYLRGGGDYDDAWAKAGRLDGREKTIDDFVACIQDIQKRLRITARHTVIHGRSAGGLLVGGTMQRYPSGNLVGGVYAEVPYVDELRTTTNPDLPLTQLEYNEFGNPTRSVQEFLSVGLLSPANAATEIKPKNVFVLNRTAEHDSEVFAYESVKWIRRLREGQGTSDAPKMLVFEDGQGHFTPPDQAIQQHTLDAALLDVWVSEGF
jgi:protease II